MMLSSTHLAHVSYSQDQGRLRLRMLPEYCQRSGSLSVNHPFIVKCDLFQTHPNSNIIQLLTVYHLAPHFREKSFFFVGIAFEKIISDKGAEYSIAEIFQPLIVLI
jgi:hypothetical protein